MSNDGAYDVAAAIDGLARAIRGDSSLAGRSTIPDNLAEIVMALRENAEARRRLPRAMDTVFLRGGASGQGNVTDGLFAIAGALDRIAVAIERGDLTTATEER